MIIYQIAFDGRGEKRSQSRLCLDQLFLVEEQNAKTIYNISHKPKNPNFIPIGINLAQPDSTQLNSVHYFIPITHVAPAPYTKLGVRCATYIDVDIVDFGIKWLNYQFVIEHRY